MAGSGGENTLWGAETRKRVPAHQFLSQVPTPVPPVPACSAGSACSAGPRLLRRFRLFRPVASRYTLSTPLQPPAECL